MYDKIEFFTIAKEDTLLTALKKIDANKKGFVIVVDVSGCFIGVLTDGDIRRALINGIALSETVDAVCNKEAKKLFVSDEIEKAMELFKDQAISFVPIVDESDRVVNIITKADMHTMLLKNIYADLTYDFMSLDTSILEHEIFPKPWGFFKTTVLNDDYQSKILSVKPGECISLQSHKHREEHWIVVHGTGEVQLNEKTFKVQCGSSFFIPKGAKHRLINLNKDDSLIINEVQIGEQLDDNDLVRYEDKYGRE